MPTASKADRTILNPLDRLRGTIRRFVVLDGLLAGGLFLLAWFWAGLALDFGFFYVSGFDWVQDAPWVLRGFALVVMAMIFATILIRRIALRFRRNFSYRSLALVLEKRYPKLLGQRLITAVELADVRRAAGFGYSEEMIRKTIDEARERIAQVPVHKVFNWHRLWSKLYLLVGLGLGLIAFSYAVYGFASGNYTPAFFLYRSRDVVGIFVERDLLLQNTPWPRSAHLELVEFPEKELRIGKDGVERQPPKVRVRAFEWVVADSSRRDGWRPLQWNDLGTQFAMHDAPSSVSVRERTDWQAKDLAAAALLGGPGLMGDQPISVRKVEIVQLSLDEIASVHGSTHPELAAVFARLTELSQDPAMSRKLRKLEIPDLVELRFNGKRGDSKSGTTQGTTRGTVTLKRDPSGEFSAEVTGLKESITFVVRAADFRTDPRDIILVPPPMLMKLQRTDRQPAYLYHSAPEGAFVGKRPAPDFQQLKGLRQSLPQKELSLTGDKTVFGVPAGTEFVLDATADKPLREVYLVPRAGRVPGAIAGSTAPIPIVPTDDRFRIAFEGPFTIAESVEFDVVMTDFDGVQSSRPIVVQAVDDKTPQVDVGIDVLRRVGNSYLCTPMARVPFLKESIVRDDAGLSRVEFQFSVTRVEAQVVVGLQAQALGGVFAFAPVIADLGAALGPVLSADLMARLSKGEQKQFAVMVVPPFERAYEGLSKDTLAVLRQKLAQPLSNTDNPPVVKDVKFSLESDVFDLADADQLLEAQGRKMRVSDAGEIQPQYKVELNIVATDTNVESGPKQGRNLEPIRLLVVSEADLLAAISDDETKLIAKLDDAIARLKDGRTKYNQTTDRLVSPNPTADTILTARVKAEDITQDLGKGKDFVQIVATEYTRLKREVEYNRVNDSVPTRYERSVIRPLEALIVAEFKAAEDSMAGFRDPLFDGRRPDDAAMALARSNLDLLIANLEVIRARLGEAISVNRLRDDLRKIIEQQKQVSEALARSKKDSIEKLFAPEIKPVAPVTLTRGEKKTLKHAVDWKVFDKGEITVRIEVPAGSGLKAPAEVLVKDDRNDFDYELTAGDVPGEYSVRLVPTVGRTVTVKVTVK